MNPLVLVGPAVEPITRADAKAYLRLDTDDEDELVDALIMAARITVERTTRLCLVTQTLRLTTARTWLDEPVRLSLAPIISVDVVRAEGSIGSFALLAPAAWHLVDEADPAQLVVDAAAAGLVSGRRTRIQVDATCGYGPAGVDVPEPLILAIRRLVAFWFEDRGDGPPRAASPWLPPEVSALIAPFRRPRLA